MPAPSLKVNEIFYSLQGEGLYTGVAAVFVRLSGCGMNCSFCDTKYAEEIKKILTPAEILKEISRYPSKTVILTGGEPAEQDIGPLCRALKKNGYQVHLETNGSLDIDVKNIDLVTVSPKKRVSKKMLLKADVIKIPFGKKTDEKEIKKYFKYAGTGKKGVYIYLQPLDNKKENVNLCVKFIKQNPFLRLSPQMHKLIKIK